MPETQLKDALAGLKSNISRAVAAMPAHDAWLSSFRAQDSPALAES
jgi:hypothetical protein